MDYVLILIWLFSTLTIATIVCMMGKKHGVEYLIALYAASIVIANITAVKIIDLFGVTVPASFIIYSATFLITDTINEIWGKKQAMKAVWVGFIALIMHVTVVQIAILIEPSTLWAGQDAFKETLSSGLRLSLASFAAFLTSQTIDVHLFAKLKKKTKNKKLWLRNNVSTQLSQSLDAVIFITIAFAGLFPLKSLIIGTILLKFVVTLMDTPFLYLIRGYYKNSKKIRKEN
ncbi:MAG: queuosine precursor transporter [Candidatus Woesearchaeota archaeon]